MNFERSLLSSGSLLLVFEGVDMSSEMRREILSFPGGAQAKGIHPVGGKSACPGGAVSLLLTNILAVKYKLQGCKISNLRI